MAIETDALSECVVTVDIVARFVANILVFSPGLTEEVVFDEGMGRGEASSAQSYLYGSAIVGGLLEIVEIVVVYPGSLGHFTASGTLHRDHLSFCEFVLEGVVIYLVIIPGN